ncbi:ABC-type transport system periplasmic substrate-binding protein (plasmid) [Haloferax gibbonsii]|uniref:ABC-type transport system periplasmic substrate-binding protein n=2 Tax=Haloferax gibbonsii TaxID=35746 RepID=A0A871BKS6_HALGI|nr:ABC transporter substrate-binding protein [Haloferax gibbonsii]ELZ85304.1 iron ABC transporter substrate-binding protein [Haloferax gibbonsii ATCC 33959]QOS13283.1 ABC-type transport system periplasmic substrate-binding protein [Haloferax gibbonsii]
MANDGHSGRESTRREYLQYGGAVVAGGLLAGCTGGGGSETTESETETTTAATTESTTEAETETTTETSESYSVSIEPMGEVTFDSVPETWVANNGSWADMGVALGLDAPMGVWLTGRYHTQYYDEIPGVSVDKSSIRQLWGDSGVGKEQFYDMDADVHIADPNFLKNRGQWSDADVEEISTQVGPFFGNSIFSRGYAWHDDYRYYDLYEAFEKLSQVFQREDRFEAFEQVHDEFQANLASVVPGQGERPSAAVVWGGGDEPEEFYPYIIDEGTSFKHLNDLKVNDALAATDVKDFFSNRGAVDFETLLDVDPEVILLRGQEAKDREEFQNTVISFMENHEVASELTAVKNDDVYRAGGLYQGPITNLVVTDRLAQTLYDADERLFDAQRVSDIVNGDL